MEYLDAFNSPLCASNTEHRTTYGEFSRFVHKNGRSYFTGGLRWLREVMYLCIIIQSWWGPAHKELNSAEACARFPLIWVQHHFQCCKRQWKIKQKQKTKTKSWCLLLHTGTDTYFQIRLQSCQAVTSSNHALHCWFRTIDTSQEHGLGYRLFTWTRVWYCQTASWRGIHNTGENANRLYNA